MFFGHIIHPFYSSFFLFLTTVLRVNDTGGIISIPNIADIALFNELIGSYSVDLMTVYKQNSHEMWRQWGVLYNSVEADDVDQQGQIKFSVSILGSDDSQRMHDASREEEDNEDDEENADIGYTHSLLFLFHTFFVHYNDNDDNIFRIFE